MATRTRSVSAPLTFDLPVSLIGRIEACRRGHAFKTASEVIRHALAEFDFESYRPSHDPHRQISVRIGTKQRALLKRHSRKNGASVGELLRLALESLPARPGKKNRR
jgi:Arc/MetJ-type ribon-helix-helix transcriptional regulator